MRLRSAKSTAASPSKRTIALIPHMVGAQPPQFSADSPQYRQRQPRAHPKPADRWGKRDCKGWAAFERQAHQRLRESGHEPPMEPNAWGADGLPFVACRERFNLAHHGGTIDRRVAQPVAVSLGKHEL